MTSTWSGSALYCGSALSSDVEALCAWGLRVTVLDAARDRVSLSMRLRSEGGARAVCASLSERLPFADGCFDLVIDAWGPPSARRLDELRRVARDELVLLLVRPRTLATNPVRLRRLLRSRGLSQSAVLALLPRSESFEQMVAVDRPAPRVAVPPRRRRQRLFELARSLGVLRAVAPSLCVVVRAAARAHDAPRIERSLAELAERLGEPRPEAEHVLASCGGTLEVLSALADEPETAPVGRWRVHVATRREHVPALEHGQRMLALVRTRCPGFPAPEPLAWGCFAGLPLACERRLAGWPLDAGRRSPAAGDGVLRQASEHFARLESRRAAALERWELEALVDGWRARAGLVRDLPTDAVADRWLDEARERLLGAALPRVVLHGDLRPRHVQADGTGGVLGYVHWSLGEELGLPGLDLLHLLLHLRRSLHAQPLGEALAAVLEPEHLRPAERDALELYSARLGIGDEVLGGLVRLYPLYAASIAGRHALGGDPGWLAREIGPLRG